MSRVRIGTRSLRITADAFLQRAASFRVDGDVLAEWADETARIMAEEVPYDIGTMAESITVVIDGDSAKIGPTNRDGQGRPIAHFHQYGYRGKPPDDFLGRTALRAREHAASMTWMDDVL